MNRCAALQSPHVGLEDPEVPVRARPRRSSRAPSGRSGARSSPAGALGAGRRQAVRPSPRASASGSARRRRRRRALRCERTASCQPTLARAGCSLVSYRSPASEVRSMPPTNATRSSITIVFSWWQCIGRSCASSAHWIRVSRDQLGRASRARRAATDGTAAAAPPPRRALARRPARRARRAGCAGRPARRRGEREVRREVPPGQVDVRAGLLELVGDRGQRLRAVDQHLDGVARARRRFARRPAARRRVERALPADPAQTPVVVIAHQLRDGAAERNGRP